MAELIKLTNAYRDNKNDDIEKEDNNVLFPGTSCFPHTPRKKASSSAYAQGAINVSLSDQLVKIIERLDEN